MHQSDSRGGSKGVYCQWDTQECSYGLVRETVLLFCRDEVGRLTSLFPTSWLIFWGIQPGCQSDVRVKTGLLQHLKRADTRVQTNVAPGHTTSNK